MKEGLIFANTRAKARENNLFSYDRIQRMMECPTLKEATRILIEANYGGGLVINEENEFEKLLQAEQSIVTDFVREVAPSGIGFECFFLKNDYHNIKSLIKAKYANLEDEKPMILPDGLYTISEIKERLNKGKLDFTPYLVDAVESIEKRFKVGEGSPRIIDIFIDKAMFQDITQRLKDKNVDHYVKDYFNKLIDTTNILSFLRVCKIGGKMSMFAQDYIEGGSLSISTFSESFSDPFIKLPETLRATPYSHLVKNLSQEDFSEYETAQDNFLLKVFAERKGDMFSVAPIIGYYLAKLNEIKVIRVILVCVKNKIPKQDMKKRVRKLYA